MFIYLLILSIGLGMDSFSASILGGVDAHGDKTHRRNDALLMSAIFGIFHVFMPISGWLFGTLIKTYFVSFDHWFAFLLLTVIGIRMMISGTKEEKEKGHFLAMRNLIPVAFATSVDAFVIGISLAILKINPFAASLIIGLIVFTMCFIGFILGEKIGSRTGKKAEILGGFILILIGIKVLVDHVF